MQERRKYEKHMWTKQEIVTVLDLWNSTSPETLTEKLGIRTAQLMYIVKQLRLKGAPLVKKRAVGVLNKMLDEVLSEQGLKK